MEGREREGGGGCQANFGDAAFSAALFSDTMERRGFVAIFPRFGTCSWEDKVKNERNVARFCGKIGFERIVIVENGGRIDLGYLWRLGVVSKNDNGYGDQLIGIFG